MKKGYMTPTTMMVAVGTEMLLAGSGVQSDNGISYGGVDEDGSKEPGARRRRNVWDGEDEEL
ncbi:MAG: hypothetical protein IJ200_10465 [Prevotella sp.]|nr:hypothetical protein [Prevotella sp.]